MKARLTVAERFVHETLQPKPFTDFNVIKKLDERRFVCERIANRIAGRVSMASRIEREDPQLFVKFLKRDADTIETQLRHLRDAHIGRVLLKGVESPYLLPSREFVHSPNYGYGVASEYYNHGSLERKLYDLELDQIAGVGMQVALGASALHQAGIIHRDIKPENVVVKGNPNSGIPRVAIIDFDYVIPLKSQEQTKPDRQYSRHIETEDDLWMRATLQGRTVGTPPYKSPEQCLGRNLTPLTDVYSTAIMLYFLLTQKIPEEYQGPNFSIVMNARAKEDKISLITRMSRSKYGADFDNAFSALIMSVLTVNIYNRNFKDSADPAREFARALANLPWPADDPIRQEPFFIEALANPNE
jgi:serine/threonine protein kinase